MRIRPLCPLIPASNEEAISLTCPPYDVVTTDEARGYLAGNPLSFMAVIRPEATLQADTSPYDPSIYEASANAFDALKTSGRLARETEHTFYVYQQQMGEHMQRGLVVLASVHDYDDGVILRHEKTRPEKEDDRTRLTDTLSANTGPVFLTYDDDASVDHLIREAVQSDPLFEVPGEDGVTHTVWRVDENDVSTLISLFERRVSVSYIADGHHRAASAARVARTRGAQAEGSTGDEEWFLSVLFPQTQLKILAYNRVVKDLNGLDTESFLTRLGEVGKVMPIDKPKDVPEKGGFFFVFVNSHWYSLQIEAESGGGVADSLDSSVLQRRVLQPILGIEDPRKSQRIEFVGGIRGVEYLEKRVSSTAAAVAFALCPVTVRQLMEVADSGEIMPPKSTWFEPKLRSGFFIHTF